MSILHPQECYLIGHILSLESYEKRYREFKAAIDEAFSKTGYDKSAFKPIRRSKIADRKSIPIEYLGPDNQRRFNKMKDLEQLIREKRTITHYLFEDAKDLNINIEEVSLDLSNRITQQAIEKFIDPKKGPLLCYGFFLHMYLVAFLIHGELLAN